MSLRSHTSRIFQPKKVSKRNIKKNLQQEIKIPHLELAYPKKLSNRLEIKTNIGSLYRSKSRSCIVKCCIPNKNSNLYKVSNINIKSLQ